MLKNISNLGNTLNREEQKNITGGFGPQDRDGRDCRYPYCVNNFGRCTHNIHGCGSGAGGNDDDIITGW